MDDSALGEFFDGLATRLGDKGYSTERGVVLSKYGIRYDIRVVGRKTGLVLKLGGVLTRYVLATSIEGVDIPTAKDYGEKSLSYALDKGPGPMGFLALGVMVSDDFTEELKNWVRKESLTRRFAAVGCPVLLSLANHKAYSPTPPFLLGRSFFGEIGKILHILTAF